MGSRKRGGGVVDKDWILCPEIDFSDYGVVGFHEELRARFLLNCIVYRRFVHDLSPIDWVYLPTRSLEIFMGGGGPHIKKTRDRLEDAGLIECDHYAIKGLKVFGYRLGPALEGVKFAKWAIPNGTYVKRFRAFREYVRRPKDLDDVGLHLMKHARALVKTDDWDDVVREASEEKGGVREVVDFFDNGWHNWSMCPMGRFHSIFTRMPSELRHSFADAKGRRLVEIDVVGSQMFYLLVLLGDVAADPEKYETPIPDEDVARRRARVFAEGGWSKYAKEYRTSDSRTLERGGEGPGGGGEQGPGEGARGEGEGDQEAPAGGPSPQYNIVQSVLALKEATDFTQFTTDVLSGEIYERWQIFRNLPSRSEAKIDLFEILYGGSYTKALIFNELYPTTGRLIEALKSVHGYWFVGRSLQRLEAERIIQGVCGTLRREHPDWSVLTCHDSIAVAPEHVEAVMVMILQAHADLEFVPVLKIKDRP